MKCVYVGDNLHNFLYNLQINITLFLSVYNTKHHECFVGVACDEAK